MLELIGNHMDNACKWAKSLVYCAISTSADDHSTRIIIEDDGAAKPTQELEQLTRRGARLDESVQGHGLGLAICKDIVKLYGGSMHFRQSEKLGGFLVEVLLPKSF